MAADEWDTAPDLNLLKTSMTNEDIFKHAENNNCKQFWFTIEPTNRSVKLPKVNPLLLKTQLDLAVPTKLIKNVRYQRRGAILINCQDCKTANYIQNINNILNTEVTTKFHIDNITTRFLLRNIHLDVLLSELKIELEEMNELKVHEIRRFIRNKNPTTTVLVTIIGTELPEKIKLWYQKIQINRFIDRPTQCHNCWNFGHPLKYCKEDERCSNCGLTKDAEHETPCSAPPKCRNCSGNHSATDKECPTYISAINLHEFKATRNIPMCEARRIFFAKKQQESYATITTQNQSSFISKQEFKTEMNLLSSNLLKIVETTCSKQINALATQVDKLTQTVQLVLAKFTSTLNPQEPIADIKLSTTSSLNGQPKRKKRKNNKPANPVSDLRNSESDFSEASDLQSKDKSTEPTTSPMETNLDDSIKPRNRNQEKYNKL